MTRRVLTAALAIVATASCAATVLAADLDYSDPPSRYGSAYDDPRYADLYGRAPPRPPARQYYEPRYEPRRSYGDGYGFGYGRPPIPREPVYRDGYGPPSRYADQRYSDAPPSERAHPTRPGACISKEEVRHELQREGWSDFHDAGVVDRYSATVKARRGSGRLFELKVDRCTGEVLAARSLEPRYGGPYAPGPYAQGPYPDGGPRRYGYRY